MGETFRGDSGPVAIGTKLGWVLSGLITSTCLVTPCVLTGYEAQILSGTRISGVERSIYDQLGSDSSWLCDDQSRWEFRLPCQRPI